MTEKDYSAIVLDASTLVAFLSTEKETQKIEQQFAHLIDSECVFYAPTLLQYELVNVLKWSKKLKPAELRQALSAVNRLRINYVELDELLLDASITKMYEHKLTFYDAAYAGLAEILDIPLLTLDQKLRKLKTITIL